jgi:hypothetical protein
MKPQPGLYTTAKGWVDPFSLFAAEDPEGCMLASVLRQDAVPARYSGAAIVTADGGLVVEGRAGEGDQFMLGIALPEHLPEYVHTAVEAAYEKLRSVFGAVKFEWVHDGNRLWIVQVHRGATLSDVTAIVPGDMAVWTEFRVDEGLDKLRALLRSLPSDSGVTVVGECGLTSHIADVLRRAGRPAGIQLAASA